jgi:hypothetical protein
MRMFRHVYIGELKPGGSLRRLSELIEQALNGSNVYLGEGEGKLLANVRFLTMARQGSKILTDVIRSRKSPTAIISFDSPLSLSLLFLSVTTFNRQEFLEYFQAEADFIGVFSLSIGRKERSFNQVPDQRNARKGP